MSAELVEFVRKNATTIEATAWMVAVYVLAAILTIHAAHAYRNALR